MKYTKETIGCKNNIHRADKVKIKTRGKFALLLSINTKIEERISIMKNTKIRLAEE